MSKSLRVFFVSCASRIPKGKGYLLGAVARACFLRAKGERKRKNAALRLVGELLIGSVRPKSLRPPLCVGHGSAAGVTEPRLGREGRVAFAALLVLWS